MTLGIVQARLGSTRLPGKMLRPLAGRPALEHTLERARAARRIDRLVVATTDLPIDDSLAGLAEALGAGVFRGHPDDVLDRYYRAAKAWGAGPGDTIVRLTGDCPMHDPAVIDRVIEEFERARAGERPAIEYASNISPPTFPSGLDVEAFSLAALEAAWRYAGRDFEREHVTLYIRDHPERFPALNVTCPEGDLSGLRWTLDVEEDARVLDSLLSLAAAHDAEEYSYRTGLHFLERDSSIGETNAPIGRNGPAVEAVFADAVRHWRERPRAKSRQTADRLREILPGSLSGMPSEAGLIAARADGCQVRDLDGNEYIDFRKGNGAIAFGCGEPKGLTGADADSGGLETYAELAERLLGRFAPVRQAVIVNSLAEAAAVGLRAAVRRTGRWRMLNFGAPLFAEELRGDGPAPLNGPELSGLEFTSTRSDGGVIPVGAIADSAAIVVEPVADVSGAASLPDGIAALCAEMDTLLIVHSTPLLIAGARLEFGDLPPEANVVVVLGRALANGLPIGVLLGGPQLFAEAPEDAGDFRSPASPMPAAAALQTLDRLEDVRDRDQLFRLGEKLCSGLQSIAGDFRLRELCEIGWRPPYVLCRFRDHGGMRGEQSQFLFDEMMLARGLMWGPVLTITPFHRDCDVECALDVARSSAPVLRTLIDNRAVERVFDAETERLGLRAHLPFANSQSGLRDFRLGGLVGIPA